MTTLDHPKHSQEKSRSHHTGTAHDTFFPHGFEDDFFGPSRHLLAADPFNLSNSLAHAVEDLLPHHHHHHRSHHDSDSSDKTNPSEEDAALAIRRSSPGYEISEVGNKFMIEVDVPGIKLADLYVDLEHHGRILHIYGQRTKTIRDENAVKEETSRFSKRFSIGKKVDVKKMTAHLEDGVLTLTAPKKKIEEPRVHHLVITEGAENKENDEADPKTETA